MPAAGLAEVAQRLREVREAHERFLALYAVEALVEPGIERAAADVMQATDRGAAAPYWHAEGGAGSSPPPDWQ